MLPENYGTTPRVSLPPKPGDMTICAHCFAALQWDEEMNVELVDWSQLSQEEADDLRRIQANVAAAKPS